MIFVFYVVTPGLLSPLILGTTAAGTATFAAIEQAGHHSLIAAATWAGASVLMMAEAAVALR